MKPQHPSILRPHDAATLILIRKDDKTPRVLMGKRHESHKFMPGKFVFPGGRVDPGDRRIAHSHGLSDDVRHKLMLSMKGKTSAERASGIALAAVRETFEETGFIIGQPGNGPKTRNESWKTFFKTGYVPDLSQIKMLARAITPPGRPRRFDTRFLYADAGVISNLDEVTLSNSDELLEPHWVTIDEARQLDLPWITGQILNRLETALESPDAFTQQLPVTYQYMRGKSWQVETL